MKNLAFILGLVVLFYFPFRFTNFSLEKAYVASKENVYSFFAMAFFQTNQIKLFDFNNFFGLYYFLPGLFLSIANSFNTKWAFLFAILVILWLIQKYSKKYQSHDIYKTPGKNSIYLL